MRIRSLLLGTCFSSLLLCGTDFYLSPTGHDGNPGTVDKPWRTIAKANDALKPGDAAVFMPGRYQGNIIPKRSGSQDAPIVYKAQKPYEAILIGGTDSVYAVEIRGKSHIVIDGFKFDVAPQTKWAFLINARHCLLKNLHMEHVTIHNPIGCSDVHFSRFQNIKAFRCNYSGRHGMLSADMWNNFNVTHCVFEKLYISRVGHRPFGFWFDCERNVVRDCIFDCRWGRNFEFFTPRQILMERCVITNAFEGSGSADGRAKLFTIDSIFRNNLIFRNGYSPLIINAYRYYDLPTFGQIRTRMYNNTWYKNQDNAWQMVDLGAKPNPHMVRGNVIKNNIMVNNCQGFGYALQISDNVAPDNIFKTNLLRGAKDGETTVYCSWPEERALTTEQANKHNPKQYVDNFDLDPQFTDVEKDDYTLKKNSPAIDRGDFLTEVTETQKSCYLPVKDPYYFYDGYRIPGERGDLILVGSDKKKARVMRVDYEAKMLTLDRKIDFKKGDKIALPYAGKAPDLGAYETDMKTSTGPVFDYRKLRQESMETSNKVLIRSTFEPEDLEQWFHLWNYTRQPASNAAIDTKVACKGKQSIRVFYDPARKQSWMKGSRLSLYVCPPFWDIDRYPFVTFSYLIPQGVPVGITVSGAPRTGRSTNLVAFIGGSPALETGQFILKNKKNFQKLIDDGKWHTVTVDARWVRESCPNIKHATQFRFQTWGNGKPKDSFWIDDFAILPLTPQK